MYESTFDARYLKLAIETNEEMIRHFWDEAGGGFFFTAEDSKEVLIRGKEVYDGAMPSANSVALMTLARLSKMTADPGLEEKISAQMDRFSEQIYVSPVSYLYFMAALDFVTGPSYEVVVTGAPDAKDTGAMLRALGERFLPNKVVLFVPDGEATEITEIASYAEDYNSIKGRATAYVCVNFSCQLPVTSVSEMFNLLE